MKPHFAVSPANRDMLRGEIGIPAGKKFSVLALAKAKAPEGKDKRRPMPARKSSAA